VCVVQHDKFHTNSIKDCKHRKYKVCTHGPRNAIDGFPDFFHPILITN